MSDRQQYNPGINPVIQQPTAEPVDTFVRPAKTPGQQLADALSEVSPEVAQFSDTLSKVYIQKQKEEGAKAFRQHSEQAQAAGDLTRLGQLPMQENPYFMSGYEEEWGRVAAGMWQSDFQAYAAQNKDLQDSVDLKDFDQAVGAHLGDWLKTHNVNRDTFFERGFGGMKDAYVANERLAFANGIEKKLDAKSDEALFALTKRAITDSWGKPGITPDNIAADIDHIVRFQVARGRPEKRARRAAAAAIRGAAMEADPDTGILMLDLLKKVPGQDGEGKLVDQSYGSEALVETKKELILQSQQNADRQRRNAEAAKKAQIDEISNAAFQELKRNPAVRLDAWLKQNYPQADSDVIRDLKGLQAEYHDLSFTTNQFVYDNLFNRIWNPREGESEVSIAEIINKSRNQQLRPEDSDRLIGMIQQRQEIAKKGAKDPLDEKAKPYIRQAEEYADGVFKDPTTGIAAGDKAERVRNAKAMLLARFEDLKSSGDAAKLGENQLNEWFVKTMDGIVKSQLSKMSISISPAPAPTIVQPGSKPQQKKPAQGAQQEKAELPQKLVLGAGYFMQLRSGHTAAVEQKMAELGIPKAQFNEFVDQQLELYNAQEAAAAQAAPKK